MEHTISRLKKYRIMSDIFRNKLRKYNKISDIVAGLVQASANNFYQGVSLADLKGFQEKYPLNSRLVKNAAGKLVEEVYRAGTPDGKVPPGRYAQYLKKANEYLEKARAVAEPGQDQVPSPR